MGEERARSAFLVPRSACLVAQSATQRTPEEREALFDWALGRFLVGEGDVHFISYFDAQCFGRAR